MGITKTQAISIQAIALLQNTEWIRGTLEVKVGNPLDLTLDHLGNDPPKCLIGLEVAKIQALALDPLGQSSRGKGHRKGQIRASLKPKGRHGV
tara:strand:+ start:729 stop:1007 length:279 start_codon:yes stop_codon:yes gene_type:complete